MMSKLWKAAQQEFNKNLMNRSMVKGNHTASPVHASQTAWIAQEVHPSAYTNE
jgi:hypothetical protein